MGPKPNRMRNLIGILKDKASLIKAALAIKRATASIHSAVIRSTTHGSNAPPPDHRIASVLALGQGSRPTARACIAAVMNRLYTTRDTYVTLKCLITLHHVVARGSFILRDQIPAGGGQDPLNLATFRDGRDVETWEISSWARWYGAVLECNLIASRILGVYISSSSSKIRDYDEHKHPMTSLLNSDLMREIDVLVRIVEEICRAPDSLHCQQNNLVYEVVNLVREDYRSTQHQISLRLSECIERIKGLSSSEFAELTRYLKRLEDCRERLVVLFVNRNRNDAFWELVRETKVKVVEAEEEERERERWVVRVRQASESSRSGERVVRPSQMLRLEYGGGSETGVHLTVSPAMA